MSLISFSSHTYLPISVFSTLHFNLFHIFPVFLSFSLYKSFFLLVFHSFLPPNLTSSFIHPFLPLPFQFSSLCYLLSYSSLVNLQSEEVSTSSFFFFFFFFFSFLPYNQINYVSVIINFSAETQWILNKMNQAFLSNIKLAKRRGELEWSGADRKEENGVCKRKKKAVKMTAKIKKKIQS